MTTALGLEVRSVVAGGCGARLTTLAASPRLTRRPFSP